ncbi:uncharacterized protein BDR25DRAFT_231222 [Lindgomyces ingoldianus]|uniref:Uncharacterized protein n=1 Tax=Lindgomyces ingoldianus TaxID=673940 RepID=A0ACB6QNP8_9PLEO|nr:uncharacterized protein BDR25DRAFT_231222 [Lindgomyces ingoldianus]KAF2468609.1 hypothetical protein BDR25DRAFT_231222 [Lindgomyces ingoldianus]
MLPPMSDPFPRMGHCEFLEIDRDDLDTSTLHAHVVGENARRGILVDRHPWVSDTSSIDAETLLQDLGRLAPTVAKDFVPKSKAVDDLVFRLINDVENIAEEETSFVALSYCWKDGSMVSPRKEVSPVGNLPFGWVREVEQFPLPTSPAMFQAVLRERQTESEGLWFDQVCINQDDEEEKAAAIGAIDTIYRNARTVVVALDDIVADEKEVAFLRHYLDQYTYSNLPVYQHPNRGLNPPFMHAQSPFRLFFERILSSTFFERAWCGHEMRLARSHVFLVPCLTGVDDGSYSFIRFTGAFFLHMLTLAMEIVSVYPKHQARKISLQQLFNRRAKMQEREVLLARSPVTPLTPMIEPFTYVTAIAETFKMKANGSPRLPEYLRRLDANRDKTCIALNASGLPLVLKPVSPLQRPSIEDECLRQLLLVGLAARDPVSLCTTGPPLQLHDGSVSWLARPTTLDIVSSSQSLPRFKPPTTQITQASDGRAEYVQLDLVFLELPHRAYPNPNFTSHVQRARTIIDLCLQFTIPSHPTWTSWQIPNHTRAPSMKNIFVQTLACCFECGANWLLDLSTRYQPSAQSLSREVVDVFCSPLFQIQNYVTTPEGRQSFTLLLNFLSVLITHGIPWASSATERSHGPMVVTLPSTHPSSSPSSISTSAPIPHPISAPTPNSCFSKAIIFAPFEYSKQLLVAVPQAVKSTDYDSLARGWILTAMNPYTGSPPGPVVNWTLQGKSRVFGDRGFNAGLAEGKGRGGHRVFGPPRALVGGGG